MLARMRTRRKRGFAMSDVRVEAGSTSARRSDPPHTKGPGDHHPAHIVEGHPPLRGRVPATGLAAAQPLVGTAHRQALPHPAVTARWLR
jgi:hypothetical protein